ncbi:MAG: chromate efflux transporter [bacterium]
MNQSLEPGPDVAPEHPRPRVPLRELALAFLKIGTVGFGGGVGMLALLREEIVCRRRWIDDGQLGVAVALGQVLPGPFISNYTNYIGHELRGKRGMAVAVAALLLPSFVLMCVLSWLYGRYGSVPLAARLFAGVQPVVAGILAWATWRIGRAQVRTLRAGLIAAAAFVALWFKVDVLWVVLGCGALGIIFSGAWRRVAPAPAFLPWLVPAVATGPGPWARAVELVLVFLKVGAVVFGGGFAAIPFIQHEVVDVRGWLTATEFLDGVALGQMTPGPVAITATFIGFRVLGLAGALLATVAVFLPSYLMLSGLIHVHRRIEHHPLVKGFLSGVMPAVTGMLLTATIFLGRAALHGPASALVGLLSLALLLRFRLEPIWLVLGGALTGLLLHR